MATQISRSATTALSTAPGQRLATHAADNFDALNEEYKDLYGSYLRLTDSFRPYDVQERIFRDRYRKGYFTGSGWARDHRKWNGAWWTRRAGTAAAAVPGTSNHGAGLAVDITGTGGFGGVVFKRLERLAPKYGFTNTEGRRVGESWHWGYVGGGQGSSKRRKPHVIATISDHHNPSGTWREKLWQTFLIATKDLPKGSADGVFGPKTDRATKAWQKRAGLKPDGVVGEHTWFRACWGVEPGDKGTRVKIAQRVMGFTGKDVDGKFGPGTERRAKEVQRWLGVTPDANWGPKTIAALLRKG